jgi:hypothetical protein
LKGIDRGRIIALIETLNRKGRRGSTARHGRDLGGASIRNRRMEPGKEDGADKWVRRVGDRGKKEKGVAELGCLREKELGRCGLKGR